MVQASEVSGGGGVLLRGPVDSKCNVRFTHPYVRQGHALRHAEGQQLDNQYFVTYYVNSSKIYVCALYWKQLEIEYLLSRGSRYVLVVTDTHKCTQNQLAQLNFCGCLARIQPSISANQGNKQTNTYGRVKERGLSEPIQKMHLGGSIVIIAPTERK